VETEPDLENVRLLEERLYEFNVQATGIAHVRRCGQIVLETHDFQAPEFYRKFGFEVAGAVDNYPRGYRSLTLSEAVAISGTVVSSRLKNSPAPCGIPLGAYRNSCGSRPGAM
jgi:hypothetical protein